MDRRSFLNGLAGSGLALGAAAFPSPLASEGELTLLTAAEIARRMRAGSISPVDVLEACLRRIDEVETSVLAWVQVDRAGALETARKLEAEARRGELRGPLHGVPVGIKDIIAVAGMTTTNGSSDFAHERPQEDAACVARLRAAGAVIVGKTHTTQFASGDPAPTRNPWNLEHTPGGSSSGSAAGVATGMVALALGTQTGGSVLRPAAYCGIVGLKPTHGRISTAGVTPLSWNLDHVGTFARSVEDAALALAVMAGGDEADPLSAAEPTSDYVSGAKSDAAPPRLGIPRWLYADRASDEVSAHLDAVASSFAREGASMEDVPAPRSAAALHEAHGIIMRVDAAAYHRERFERHADSYRPYIRGIVEAGLEIPGVEYARARRTQGEFRRELSRAVAGLDALLLPVAPTAAPKGLQSTGDPSLCVPGSLSGLPAIALPSGLGGQGLPLAVQLIGHPFGEAGLLATARWCEAVLGFGHAPRL